MQNYEKPKERVISPSPSFSNPLIPFPSPSAVAFSASTIAISGSATPNRQHPSTPLASALSSMPTEAWRPVSGMWPPTSSEAPMGKCFWPSAPPITTPTRR